MKINVLHFDSLGSTNSEAIEHAKRGADEGLCIVARQQTAGRGRHGRTWVSEKDAGLYFSIVLRPGIETSFLPLITLMSGVAVHDTLEEYGVNSDIKWVNDILVGDDKIAGILAETTDTPKGLSVVVGIGINLRSSNFPAGIADISTSIELETGETPNADDLANTLTGYIAYFYEILNSENGLEKILDEWRKRSSYYSGKNVRVVLENETLTGFTDGLEANGALRLKTGDGSVKIIQAGDVEQLRPSERGAVAAGHDTCD
jgi:BirA family biotin operon repressor/biotin-[acetyl-CoA-carboxylase] ligase